MYNFIYSDGSVSNHDTLEGMVEMLLLELDGSDREMQSRSYYEDGWCKDEMIDFITMFDVEVIENEDEE